MSTLKAGIIGTGRVSAEHARAYIASGVEVVAFCGRTIEGAQRKVQELGFSDARCYDSVDIFLNKEDCQLVSIVGPPELHSAHVISVASAGRHMAIEKPVALDRASLDAMVLTVENHKVKTVVGFVLRWNELIQHIRGSFQPRIGSLGYLEVDYWHGSSASHSRSIHEYGTRDHPIGAFLGGGCHAVDMARHFMNEEEIRTVVALPTGFPEGDIVALASFASGATAKISALDGIFCPYIFNMTLFGQNGVIDLNRFYARDIFENDFTKDDFQIIPGQIPDSGAVWHHPFSGMIAELVSAVATDAETSCSLRSTHNTHLACFAAQESVQFGGKRIVLS